MSAKKAAANPRPLPLRLLSFLAGARAHRAVLMIGGLVLGFTGGAYVLWQNVAERVMNDADYLLTAERIQISSPPEWITTDIRAEVVRDASLDRPISILEAGVVEQVAQAFALHPWVEHVQQVSKHHPARVDVVLSYRRPVAMVEVPGGLYPVDITGILLPSADFSAEQARDYPRLSGIDTIPVGPVGTYWGDHRVRGGAAIAAQLGDVWIAWGLARIVPSDASATGTYDLFTRGQTKILWGHAPPAEAAGEATVEEKLAHLADLVAQYGSLDAADVEQIDLRTPRPGVTPHTAQSDESDKR